MSRVVEAVIERTSPSLESSWGDAAIYGVGRVVGSDSPELGPNGGGIVLAKLASAQHSEVVLDERSCIAVPTDLGLDEALLAPPLALALWAWDRLRLELGEVAVYTEGDALSSLIGQVGLWRGGCPVIRLSGGEEPSLVEGIESLSTSRSEDTGRTLRERIKEKPGCAAIDLTGRPEIIDLLLEVMPRWGRVMLAGSKGARLTVDFYNNIHRKGVLLLTTVFDPVRVFGESWGPPYLTSAFRILQNRQMAAACLRAIRGLNP